MGRYTCQEANRKIEMLSDLAHDSIGVRVIGLHDRLIVEATISIDEAEWMAGELEEMTERIRSHRERLNRKGAKNELGK